MRTKIENIWDTFYESDLKKFGILHRRYSVEMIPDGFIAMRFPDRTRCIAFRISCEKQKIDKLNDLIEIKCEILKDETQPDKYLLVFTLLDNTLISIFAVLCEDLFQSVFRTDKEDELIQSLKNRFIKWKELFSIAKGGGLSDELQIGLYGELTMLKKLIEVTHKNSKSLSIWTGPEAGIRDFENGSCALEVKTSHGHNHQKIKISSERQLDTNLLDKLFLFHLSFEKRNSSENTLNHLIEKLFSILNDDEEAKQDFKRKLHLTGWFEHQKELYSNTSYFVRNENFYHVANNFPRIEENELRKGVGDLKYSIILSSDTEPYTTNLNTIIQNFDLK
jgi:hypothetical protein